MILLEIECFSDNIKGIITFLHFIHGTWSDLTAYNYYTYTSDSDAKLHC